MFAPQAQDRKREVRTRNFLVGLTQNADEVARTLGVARREEGDGRARCAGASRTANLVHVVLRVGGEVVVDD